MFVNRITANRTPDFFVSIWLFLTFLHLSLSFQIYLFLFGAGGNFGCIYILSVILSLSLSLSLSLFLSLTRTHTHTHTTHWQVFTRTYFMTDWLASYSLVRSYDYRALHLQTFFFLWTSEKVGIDLTPPSREGCDTTSIFQQIKAGLNLEFSFS